MTIEELNALAFVPLELKKRCQDLTSLGIDSVAWNKEDAIKLINLLSVKDIPILGGDFFRMNNSELEITDINWFYNRKENDCWKEYVKNSADKALDFIKKISINNEAEFFIDIVTPR